VYKEAREKFLFRNRLVKALGDGAVRLLRVLINIFLLSQAHPELDCKIIRFTEKTNQFMTRFLISSFSDPPEITVESPVVYSGEGQEAMLVCIVHGEAQPEVSCYAKSFYENSLTC
jgi:hypothetical protein